MNGSDARRVILTEKATMFRRLQIKNFRLFSDLEINWLSRINLIAGRNNCGKTTVLEALFLLCGAGNAELVLRINAFRRVHQVQGFPSIVPEIFWNPLFFDFDMGRSIEIIGKLAGTRRMRLTIAPERESTIRIPRDHISQSPHKERGGITDLQDAQVLRTGGAPSMGLRLSCNLPDNKRREGHIGLTEQGVEIKRPTSNVPFQAVFLSSHSGNLQEDANRLGHLRRRKQGDLLTEALRIVEPRLQSVEDISASGFPMLWGDIGLSELVPLSAMGEGMTHIARIVLAISSAPSGVVLIDEIENGIHYSIMDKVWAVVLETARLFDTQIFATTHSFECFKSAHDALRGDWRYHRLDRTGDDSIHCVTFDQENVKAAVRHGLEVR